MAKCSVEECAKQSSCRGWCLAHYYAWRRHGDPLYKRQFKKDAKCTVDGCERKQAAKGHCKTHGMKLRRSGTLDYIRETETYKRRWLEARLSPISKLDGHKDPKSRGYLATNLISDLRYKASQRQIPWYLDNLDVYNLIKSPCHYCGFKPDWPEFRCGIDRIDNFKGYHRDNVVACCSTCNTAKGIKTQDEFKEWIVAISNHYLK